MICPACRQDMIVIEYKQIELDVCTSCKGVWFDADELELLLRSLDLHHGELFRDPPEKPAEKPRKCPYCRRKMAKILAEPGDVLIDKCVRGHGLWFDGNELDTIIQRMQAPAVGADSSSKAGAREVASFLGDVLLGSGRNKAEKGGQE